MKETKTRRSGQTLVATLITIAIILVLVVVLFKGSGAFGLGKQASARPDGKGTTIIGQVMYDAKDDVCRSNLGQVRAAIQVYESTNDDKPPETLQETKIGSDFYRCPVGHEPYQYDPVTGLVHCIHPGHDKY